MRNFDGKKIGMKMMEEFKQKREAEEQGASSLISQRSYYSLGPSLNSKMPTLYPHSPSLSLLGNAIKVLENRTLDNKMEIEILDALDEIRSLNAKTSKLDPEEVLHKVTPLCKPSSSPTPFAST